MRIFYASAGRADLIGSHESWAAGGSNPSQVSLTFSGQVQDVCRALGATTLMVSDNPDGRRFVDGPFEIEHRAKRARTGAGFFVEEARYAWMLARRARRFGADVAIIDSGVTQHFLLWLFRLLGIAVVPVLHNSLWPAGFRPRSGVRRLILALDGLFWRFGPQAIVVVSPEIERQVRALAPGLRAPIHQARAQFVRDYFAAIAPVARDARPFRVTFVGRLERDKGALDIPAMARRTEEQAPGLIRWTVCGAGPHLEALRETIAAEGLGDVVEARGWTSPRQLQDVYGQSHAMIVPTRSAFAEGFAMTAVEAILSGRPLVSNPVVPALELLAPAAVAAVTDDPVSHADAVLALATDGALYDRLRAACPALAAPFYDRAQGLAAALERALAPATASPSRR